MSAGETILYLGAKPIFVDVEDSTKNIDPLKLESPGEGRGGPGGRLERDRLALALREDGIGTSVHFKPLHLFPYYQERFGVRAGQHPVAERCFQETPRCPSTPISRIQKSIASWIVSAPK